MYDFYFGSPEEIGKDPRKFLLTVKRMMPRWCNGIPDSEFLALYDVIAAMELPPKPVFIETGSGASTIVLSYFAVKHGGELYTWDVSGSKLFYLRGVINDTLMRHFDDRNLSAHWKHIAFDSNSEFAGIRVLKELGRKVSACFFDSEHTLNVLMSEVKSVCDVLADTAVVAIDDANYSYINCNTAYINMVRKKLGLAVIQEPPGNIGRPFWAEVEGYLKTKFALVEHLDDSYKKNYQSDIFWSYYRSDREAMASLAMEKTEDLEHRFDAWRICRS